MYRKSYLLKEIVLFEVTIRLSEWHRKQTYMLQQDIFFIIFFVGLENKHKRYEIRAYYNKTGSTFRLSICVDDLRVC